MHNEEIDLSIDHLSKIEGHATLDLKIRGKKVETANLKITENKRFYTQAIRGKHFLSAPQLMSRICGTCSIAHLLCCIRSIENAFEVNVSEQTETLRLLSMNGMYIRDHALHLYLFALPDILGKDSLLDFDEKKPKEKKWLESAFAVKSAGNMLSQTIAGRAVHAPFPVVGGHLGFPKKEEVEHLTGHLEKARTLVVDAMSAFRNCKFSFERKTVFVSVSGKDFIPYGEEIYTSENERFSVKKYFDYLERIVIPYSQSVGYKFKEGEYMLGALARLNLNKSQLNPRTQKDASDFLKLFPSANIFHNNLAQAIEILHCIDQSIDLLSGFEFKKEEKVSVTPKQGEGFAAVEAPRGILFYNVKINAKGIIEEGTVVVPTQQNQIKMESDIKELVEGIIERDKEFIQLEVEKLIRAYDPCMSCASHFLRINWT